MNNPLESERLIYLPFHLDYRQALFDLDTSKEVMQYLGGVEISTMEETEADIVHVQKQYEDHGIGRYLVIEKSSEQCLGWTGLKWIEEQAGYQNYLDIGYRLLPSCWGKGYATESARFWLAFAKAHFPQYDVHAAAHRDNIGSRKVLEKIGLKLTQELELYNLPCVWYSEE